MGRKYRRTAPIEEIQPCYYCGLPADSVDHVVPRAFLEMLRSLGHGEVANHISRRQVLEVPCCRECNSCLGCDVQPNLAARKAAAKEHLRKKYRRFLESPRWMPYELDELGPDLRKYVEWGESIRDLIRRRLAW